MKRSSRIIILISVVFFLACGPKQKVSVLPAKAGPGDELFSRAEKMFQAKSYSKALDIYYEYISRFPDRPLVDDALMRIGAIYTAIEEYEKARNIYKHLIAEHPSSSYVIDARVEILATYYNQGKYKEVFENASDILKDTHTRIHLVKTNFILGNTYLAIGFPLDALAFYIKAYNRSKDSEKENIVVKLKEAIGLMGSADIKSLLQRLKKDEMIVGYLMFRLGMNNIDEEKYDEAIQVLSEFIKRFPDHESAQTAEILIEELGKKSVYSRYTLGCILPLSGRYKVYGNKALKGIELALSQLNSEGDHPPLKIIVKDTESDPVTTALAVVDLFNEHVAAIIGPIIAAESAALEAQDRGIPIITLTQKDNITNIGDYVFTNFFTPRMQVKAIVSFAFEVLGLNRFAILYPDENYGKTFMNLFWDEVIAHGGKVTGIESYNSAQTDFSDTIKKLVGLYYEMPKDLQETTIPIEGDEKPKAIIDFDAVFIPDAPEKAGLIIPQLVFHDIDNIHLFGTNLWHSDKLIEMTRQYVQGAIMTDGFFAESDAIKVRDFVGIFELTYGEKPGFIEAVAYDTAIILLQMLSRSDIFFRNTLRDELMKLENFEGVTGLTSFNKDGDVRKKLYLLQIRGDHFVELEYQAQDD